MGFPLAFKIGISYWHFPLAFKIGISELDPGKVLGIFGARISSHLNQIQIKTKRQHDIDPGPSPMSRKKSRDSKNIFCQA